MPWNTMDTTDDNPKVLAFVSFVLLLFRNVL